MGADPDIFFHVGLGKVASSYLQQRIFPKLEGIYYLPTQKYKNSKAIIPKLNAEKILVSREFDRQFEREVRWFTETYPQARIIIIFRQHDSWIASQYKRHVKNGWYHDFEDFLDLKKDRGLWKQEDLLFYPKLEIIQECCQEKPLVLFYDELVQNPEAFFGKLSTYTNTTLPKDEISLRPVHSSYSEKQLKVLKSFCARAIRKVPDGYTNKFKHWLLYRPFWLLFHLTMYAAYFVPARFISKKPLISKAALRAVREAYADDWQRVVDYAEQNNPDI